MAEARVAEQFEDLPRQAHAAKLGMWVFLVSEVLLFIGLFALYASYRVAFTEAFVHGVHHNTRLWGSINTLVLLTSSFAVALAVVRTKEGLIHRATRWLGVAMALGVVFLGIKFYEYWQHVHEGILPGGRGDYFLEHPQKGLMLFYTLYYLMTGLHAVHMVVGLVVLTVLVVGLKRRWFDMVNHHGVQIGAMYWHFVDVVWLFLWPCFYLMGGS